jgi:anti-anti-sigma factor
MPFRSSTVPRALGLLGIPVHDTTLANAVLNINSPGPDGKTRFVLTADTALIRACEADVEISRILCEAEMVLCTDRGVARAAARVGVPLIETFEEPELLDTVFAHAAPQKRRIFLLDDNMEHLEAVARAAAAAHPGLEIVGTSTPGEGSLLEFSPDAIAERLREAGADLLVVGLPRPDRDKWIAMNYRALGVPCILGIDLVLAGLEDRRRSRGGGLRGHLDDFGTVWRGLRAHSSACRPLRSPARIGDWQIRSEAGALRLIAPPDIEGPVSEVPIAAVTGQPRGAMTILDLEALERIGPAGLGTLFTVARACFRQGTVLRSRSARGAVADCFRLFALDRIFPSADGDPVRTAAVASQVVTGGFTVRCRPPVELTATTAPAFRSAVEEGWAANGDALRLVAEMQSVRFMDSSGLGTLLAMRRLAESRPGGRFVVEGVGGNVRTVIRLAQLDGVFGLND